MTSFSSTKRLCILVVLTFAGCRRESVGPPLEASQGGTPDGSLATSPGNWGGGHSVGSAGSSNGARSLTPADPESGNGMAGQHSGAHASSGGTGNAQVGDSSASGATRTDILHARGGSADAGGTDGLGGTFRIVSSFGPANPTGGRDGTANGSAHSSTADSGAITGAGGSVPMSNPGGNAGAAGNVDAPRSGGVPGSAGTTGWLGCAGRPTVAGTAACVIEPQTNWFPLQPEVIAGIDVDGSALAVCRATHNGGIHPGKRRLDDARVSCEFGWGGKAVTAWASAGFEGLRLEWALGSDGEVPTNAYQFGRDRDLHPLYPCRAIVGTQQHLGMVGAALGACSIAYEGGTTRISKDYEVLINDPAIHFPLDQETLIRNANPPVLALRGVSLASNPTQVYFLCSAEWDGGTYPGKIRGDWTVCKIAYGDSEISVGTYRVLKPSFKSHDPVYRSFWPAGNERNGDKLGICRVDTTNGLQVGKYLPTEDRCHFSFDVYENVVPTSGAFEVLRP